MAKRDMFKVEDDKIVRLRKNCPKCGVGVFLAEHNNRLSCGACGYTEFKSEKKPIVKEPVVEEKKEKVADVEIAKKQPEIVETKPKEKEAVEETKESIAPSPEGQPEEEVKKETEKSTSAPPKEESSKEKTNDTSAQPSEAVSESQKEEEKKED
ncbi:ribosomal protein S27AE [Thermoplasmatales archaeon SCGC AB-539-N05]|nr:ribosomal protein S27AE [Thermoplasmatales archaeon SCGC AB-539-N05]